MRFPSLSISFLSIFFLFLSSYPLLSLCRKRLIVTHHKTGTMLARKLKYILSTSRPNFDSLSRQYEIATIGDGLESIGLDEGWTNVVHLMRNPFSMVLSSYFYHMTTSENWVHCPITKGREWINPICPFKSKFNTVQKTLNYIHDNLDSTLNLTGLPLDTTIYKYPKPSGSSTYQTYLKKLPPIQGVIVEMFRVNYHDVPSMISDYLLMEKMSAYYSQPNNYPLHLKRSYHSICLESLTSVSSTGQVINSEEGLKKILNYLDLINIPPSDMIKISAWVNRGTELHQTNHSNSSRSHLESVIRWYDKNRMEGIFHHYEKLINCGNVGGSHHHNENSPLSHSTANSEGSPVVHHEDSKKEGKLE